MGRSETLHPAAVEKSSGTPSIEAWFAGGERFGYDPKAAAIVASAPLKVFLKREGDLAHAVSFLPQLDGSKLPYLSRPQCGKTIQRNACRAQGVRKRKQRRVNRFIGELERAVMMGQGNTSTAIDQRLHRLGWVHVVVAHKPTRLVSTDGENNQFKRPVTFSCTAKIVPVAVTRVSDKINASAGRIDHERCP
jgi:hypothetical protein